MLRRTTALMLVSILFLASTAVAQNRSSGVGFRIAPGIGYASASFGDNSPRSSSSFAFTLGGLVLFPVSSTTDIVLEATWRPTELDNPHFDESFSSVTTGDTVAVNGRMNLRSPSDTVRRARL